MLVSFRVLDEQIRGSLVRERLMATLSGFFGALAGLLAAIGLYGVLSYLVARRRFEIGLRMALGADRSRVLRMILGESSVLVGAGLVLGVALALLTTRWSAALLFGLQPHRRAAARGGRRRSGPGRRARESHPRPPRLARQSDTGVAQRVKERLETGSAGVVP